MKRIAVLFFCLLLFRAPAQALFLLENDDMQRAGRAAVSAAQLAGGTAINISWGIWSSSDLYLVFGPGAGLGWKQRLLTENSYWPLAWDISAETTSLQNYHATAYGTSLVKRLNEDISLFIKYESVENTNQWPGLPDLKYGTLASAGLTWRLWQNSRLLLQGSGGPNPFGTLGFHVIL